MIYLNEYNEIQLNFLLEPEENISRKVKNGNYLFYIRNIEKRKINIFLFLNGIYMKNNLSAYS